MDRTTLRRHLTSLGLSPTPAELDCVFRCMWEREGTRGEAAEPSDPVPPATPSPPLILNPPAYDAPTHSSGVRPTSAAFTPSQPTLPSPISEPTPKVKLFEGKFYEVSVFNATVEACERDARVWAAEVEPTLAKTRKFDYRLPVILPDGTRVSNPDAIPPALRLGRLFLHGLARDEENYAAGFRPVKSGVGHYDYPDRMGDVVDGLPNVVLRRPLLSGRDADADEVVEVSAAAMDAFLRETNCGGGFASLALGPGAPPLELPAEGPDGKPKTVVVKSSADLFGGGVFRMTRREVAELEASTRVYTDALLPPRFYAKLVDILSADSTVQWAYDRRSVPLLELARREKASELGVWVAALAAAPFDDPAAGGAAWGFVSEAVMQTTLKLSFSELSTCVALVQEGYFFVDGSNRIQQREAGAPGARVVFMSAAAVDFNSQASARLEYAKYFSEKDFLPGGCDALKQRIKNMYRLLYTALRDKGVRDPTFMSIGLGVFIPRMRHPEVKRLYVAAQLELLEEVDWGFDTYWLLPTIATRPALELLASRHYRLKCRLALLGVDAKVLAICLQNSGRRTSYLNPSDSIALLQGRVGYWWEVGKGERYVGEEDFAATTTGILAHCNITRALTGAVRRLHSSDPARYDEARVSSLPSTLLTASACDADPTLPAPLTVACAHRPTVVKFVPSPSRPEVVHEWVPRLVAMKHLYSYSNELYPEAAPGLPPIPIVLKRVVWVDCDAALLAAMPTVNALRGKGVAVHLMRSYAELASFLEPERMAPPRAGATRYQPVMGSCDVPFKPQDTDVVIVGILPALPAAAAESGGGFGAATASTPSGPPAAAGVRDVSPYAEGCDDFGGLLAAVDHVQTLRAVDAYGGLSGHAYCVVVNHTRAIDPLVYALLTSRGVVEAVEYDLGQRHCVDVLDSLAKAVRYTRNLVSLTAELPREGFTEAALRLIRRGVSPDFTPTLWAPAHWAAYHPEFVPAAGGGERPTGAEIVLRELIESRHGDVDILTTVGTRGVPAGCTPLHVAAIRHNVRNVEVLLALGASRDKATLQDAMLRHLPDSAVADMVRLLSPIKHSSLRPGDSGSLAAQADATRAAAARQAVLAAEREHILKLPNHPAGSGRLSREPSLSGAELSSSLRRAAMAPLASAGCAEAPGYLTVLWAATGSELHSSTSMLRRSIDRLGCVALVEHPRPPKVSPEAHVADIVALLTSQDMGPGLRNLSTVVLELSACSDEELPVHLELLSRMHAACADLVTLLGASAVTFQYGQAALSPTGPAPWVEVALFAPGHEEAKIPHVPGFDVVPHLLLSLAKSPAGGDGESSSGAPPSSRKVLFNSLASPYAAACTRLEAYAAGRQRPSWMRDSVPEAECAALFKPRCAAGGLKDGRHWKALLTTETPSPGEDLGVSGGSDAGGSISNLVQVLRDALVHWMWEPVDQYLCRGRAYDAATSYCLEEGYKQGAPLVYVDVKRPEDAKREGLKHCVDLHRYEECAYIDNPAAAGAKWDGQLERRAVRRPVFRYPVVPCNVGGLLLEHENLLLQMRDGNCVAFVGAGFTIPACGPSWKNLLERCASEALATARAAMLEKTVVEQFEQLKVEVERLVSQQQNHSNFQLAAQLMEDTIQNHLRVGTHQHTMQGILADLLRKAVMVPRRVLGENMHSPDLYPVMAGRLRLLHALDFNSFVTTNYTLDLCSCMQDCSTAAHERHCYTCSHDTCPLPPQDSKPPFMSIVRPSLPPPPGVARLREPPLDFGLPPEATADALTTAGMRHLTTALYRTVRPSIQIHGSVHTPASIVFTREGYRRLMQDCPRYVDFLKSLLASRTILYLGFSFTDEYLNEVRSDIMAMKRKSSMRAPLGYAIIPGLKKVTTAYYHDHEGVEMLTWQHNLHGFGVMDRLMEALLRFSNTSAALSRCRVILYEPTRDGSALAPAAPLVEWMSLTAKLHEAHDSPRYTIMDGRYAPFLISSESNLGALTLRLKEDAEFGARHRDIISGPESAVIFMSLDVAHLFDADGNFLHTPGEAVMPALHVSLMDMLWNPYCKFMLSPRQPITVVVLCPRPAVARDHEAWGAVLAWVRREYPTHRSCYVAESAEEALWSVPFLLYGVRPPCRAAASGHDDG